MSGFKKGDRVRKRGYPTLKGSFETYMDGKQETCAVLWDDIESPVEEDVESIIAMDTTNKQEDTAYRLPKDYGIKRRFISMGTGKDKMPAIQVSLHETYQKPIHDPYEYMGIGLGGLDSYYNSPRKAQYETVYRDETIGPIKTAQNLSELSLMVGELIVEAIEHKGYGERLAAFQKEVTEWTKETGVTLN